jgi:hypothetical protein
MSTQEGSGTSGYATPGAGTLEEKGRALGRRADEVGARLQTGLRDKAQGVTAKKEHFVQRVHDGRARVAHEVQAHPVRTLLAVFGAGAVLGLMFRRRSRS